MNLCHMFLARGIGCPVISNLMRIDLVIEVLLGQRINFPSIIFSTVVEPGLTCKSSQIWRSYEGCF